MTLKGKKQLKIKNVLYYKILIGILVALIIYNLYASIKTQNLFGFLPILIQIILIYFLISKQPFSQKVIRIWIIVVFFVAQGLKIIGIGLEILSEILGSEKNEFDMLSSERIIYAIILITIGLIVWFINKEFGEIEEIDETYYN